MWATWTLVSSSSRTPAQIIDALLPLYLNSTLLRSLQVQIHLCAWRSVWL